MTATRKMTMGTKATRSERALTVAKSLLRVRREKALDFSGCNSRPGTGSLHRSSKRE
jgi:hypothetical protein